MTAALVTICIPTYNGATHLAQCLDSVLCQTYESLEILVVDDVSDDDTREIVSRHFAQEPRLRFVRNAARLGLAATGTAASSSPRAST